MGCTGTPVAHRTVSLEGHAEASDTMGASSSALRTTTTREPQTMRTRLRPDAMSEGLHTWGEQESSERGQKKREIKYRRGHGVEAGQAP